MANCFIPSSTPAIGRTSTRSSRRLRRRNNAPISFLAAFRPPNPTSCWRLRFFNAQRSIHSVGRSMLGVGRWAFYCLRRVKGAWWPSRSSKPSSSRKWRGRFDSYPLRRNYSTLSAQRPILNAHFRQLDVGRWMLSVGRFLLLNSKGGEPHVA
jgi:hypothetical protein